MREIPQESPNQVLEDVQDWFLLNVLDSDVWQRRFQGIYPFFVVIICQILCTAIFGGYVQQVISDLTKTPTLSKSVSYWIGNWPGLFSFVASAYGFLAQRVNEDRKFRAKMVRTEIQQIYNEIELGKNKDDDVRCTIWCPIGRHADGIPLKMQQLIDYVPLRSKRSGTNTGWDRNVKAGRIITVTRVRQGQEIPIGLVGQCAHETINARQTNKTKPIELYSIIWDGTTDFIVWMKDNLNYARHHAKSLKRDRKAYLCIPVVNSEGDVLLGIIYLDSRNPNIFTEDVQNKIVEHLPRIGDIISVK